MSLGSFTWRREESMSTEETEVLEWNGFKQLTGLRV